MNLHLTEQQHLLRESMEKLFLVESSPARIRAAEAHGIDQALWQQLLACGIGTMRVPEAAGGAGMGLFEACLVAEKAGSHLASVPLAEALPAIRLLAEVGGTPAARLLARVHDGLPVLLVPRVLRDGTAEVVPTATACVLLALDGDEVLALRRRRRRPKPVWLAQARACACWRDQARPGSGSLWHADRSPGAPFAPPSKSGNCSRPRCWSGWPSVRWKWLPNMPASATSSASRSARSRGSPIRSPIR